VGVATSASRSQVPPLASHHVRTCDGFTLLATLHWAVEHVLMGGVLPALGSAPTPETVSSCISRGRCRIRLLSSAWRVMLPRPPPAVPRPEMSRRVNGRCFFSSQTVLCQVGLVLVRQRA